MTSGRERKHDNNCDSHGDKSENPPTQYLKSDGYRVLQVGCQFENAKYMYC